METTSPEVKAKKSSKYLIFIVFFLFIIVLGVFLFFIFTKDKDSDSTQTSDNQSTDESNDSEAVQAGKLLSNNKCSGEGSVELTKSAMNPDDFGIIIPYGLMVGGHVTPIDHQYFTPKDQQSPRDSYDVMALADGRIVDIGPRARVNPNDPTDTFEEYRIVFSHTCTFLTYFDLVTSLAPDLKAEYDRVKDPNGYAGAIDFKVKAGQVIGKIGGQTLDFAVWDTKKPLTGFITPELYRAESWKLYTANPYDYMTDDLK